MEDDDCTCKRQVTFSYWINQMVLLSPPNILYYTYSKTCVKQALSKRQKIGLQDKLSFNAGQKYCRMLHREHSAILSTFIKLPFVIKIFQGTKIPLVGS